MRRGVLVWDIGWSSCCSVVSSRAKGDARDAPLSLAEGAFCDALNKGGLRARNTDVERPIQQPVLDGSGSGLPSRSLKLPRFGISTTDSLQYTFKVHSAARRYHSHIERANANADLCSMQRIADLAFLVCFRTHCSTALAVAEQLLRNRGLLVCLTQAIEYVHTGYCANQEDRIPCLRMAIMVLSHRVTPINDLIRVEQ